MQRLIIYSRPPSRIKSFLKKILGVKRGPDTLTSMLLDQLREYVAIHPDTYHLIVNPSLRTLKDNDIIHIVQNTKDLRNIISLKQIGLVCKIIVGPTMVVHPSEDNSILLSPFIDAVLMPSRWPADFIIHEAPLLKDKVHIWPVGSNQSLYTRTNTQPAYISAVHIQKQMSCVIYHKQYGTEQLDHIIKLLNTLHISYTIFTYGSYAHQKYIETLAQSDFMIYLSQSESQGIALQEAWFTDVPTFVLESHTWNYKEYSWIDPHINAPYLSPRLGAIFTSIDELNQLITSGFKQYSPREEAQKTLSSTTSNMIYFHIINNL